MRCSRLLRQHPTALRTPAWEREPQVPLRRTHTTIWSRIRTATSRSPRRHVSRAPGFLFFVSK